MNTKSRYELKEVVCDYGIYENGELKLIINDYMNATMILDVLKHDEQHKSHKSIFIDNLKKLYKYHKAMRDKSIVDLAESYHRRQCKTIFDALRIVGRGEVTPWNKDCYQEDNKDGDNEDVHK